MTAFFILILIHSILNECPGFKKEGYYGRYYQKKKDFYYCAVKCDKHKGYHPTESTNDVGSTVAYYTIYKRKVDEKEWVSIMKDTDLDLNCQYGCESFVEEEKDPHNLKAIEKSIIAINPIRYYRAVVECKDGYYAKNRPEKENGDKDNLKIFMDCKRNASISKDIWGWNEDVLEKLECVLGCKRFGITIPVHQNSYGAETTCDNIGDSNSKTTNLVSNCEAMCNEMNGYFSTGKGFMQMNCGSDEKNQIPLSFLCDQGCKKDKETVNYLLYYKHMKMDCNLPFYEDWNAMCGLECSEGYVVEDPGLMGIRDVVFCRRGKFLKDMLRMKCSKHCRYDSDCHWPRRCIGKNKYKQKFCSLKRVDYSRKD